MEAALRVTVAAERPLVRQVGQILLHGGGLTRRRSLP